MWLTMPERSAEGRERLAGASCQLVPSVMPSLSASVLVTSREGTAPCAHSLLVVPV
jgi:hypothetical protein